MHLNASHRTATSSVSPAVISCSHNFCPSRYRLKGPSKTRALNARHGSTPASAHRLVKSVNQGIISKATATETADAPSTVTLDGGKPKASILAVVPGQQQHALGVSWHEVMSHVADRLTWEDPDFKVRIFTDEALGDEGAQSDFVRAAKTADILLVLDIQKDTTSRVLLDSMHIVPTAIALGSLPELEAAVTLNNVAVTRPWEKAAAATLPWSSSAKGSKLLKSIRNVYKRHTSDDLLFLLLVLIDAYLVEVCMIDFKLRRPTRRSYMQVYTRMSCIFHHSKCLCPAVLDVDDAT